MHENAQLQLWPPGRVPLQRGTSPESAGHACIPPFGICGLKGMTSWSHTAKRHYKFWFFARSFQRARMD